MPVPAFFSRTFGWQSVIATVAMLAGCANGPRPPEKPTAPDVVPLATRSTAPAPGNVALGIDVFEAQGFRELQGKRVGLLTHTAGVNRFGVPTVDVLRRDARVNLVALFGVEHGIHGKIPAGEKYEDHLDQETRLPVYSLYNGRTRWATPEQLRHIDVLVIDLQDIGTRSYTFVSAMLYQLEACFQNNVEVIVLDRPNPLGGLKVSGPITDPEWINYLGAARVPYVHGLTIGEFAAMAASERGILGVPGAGAPRPPLPDDVRQRGRLTVVRMQGWSRSMTWPQTGLRWVATSPYIQSFDAVVGYPMTGLGAQLGGFRHGIGTPEPFRLLTHPEMTPANLAAALNARRLPGLSFVVRQSTNARGDPLSGVRVEVTDWNAWRPTDLNFHLMQMACATSRRNPFAAASAGDAELYNKHVGSSAWWNALKREGARINVARYIAAWDQQAQAWQQQQARRFWFYR
jgi:uncharacterized protein YbbC (DUF1343 family)